MANWACLDENNIVTKVIYTSNEDLNEGYDWIINNFPGKWVQTSYNNNFRKNYAGIGYKYDENKNAFIPPKPYSSWVLDENTCTWISPVKYPKTNFPHIWNEEEKKWEIA